MSAYQGVRNMIFFEISAYILKIPEKIKFLTP